MKDNGEQAREQISALVDGELDGAQAAKLLAQEEGTELRDTWGLYHRIGDVIRSEAMAGSMSPDFSARFASRLAAEPTVLAPRRSLASRMIGWPTTLAAAAAAGIGFFVAPSLFEGGAPGLPSVGPSPVARISHGSQLADAGEPARREVRTYLLMHQRAHPAPFGADPLVRPATLDGGSDL